jgi:hypothetical protein
MYKRGRTAFHEVGVGPVADTMLTACCLTHNRCWFIKPDSGLYFHQIRTGEFFMSAPDEMGLTRDAADAASRKACGCRYLAWTGQQPCLERLSGVDS